MFNGVRGEGIKKFFSGRKGRNLSFASNEPVKIQAGADIAEIAQGAVDKNTDNLIIASLSDNWRLKSTTNSKKRCIFKRCFS